MPPKINQEIRPAAADSAETFGVPIINSGASGQTISGAGAIVSAESFGMAQFKMEVRPAAAVSAEVFGTARLNQELRALGIATGESAGTPELNQSIRPVGLGSGEAMGIPRLNQEIKPSGVASGEVFGLLVVFVGGVIQLIKKALGIGILRDDPIGTGNSPTSVATGSPDESSETGLLHSPVALGIVDGAKTAGALSASQGTGVLRASPAAMASLMISDSAGDGDTAEAEGAAPMETGSGVLDEAETEGVLN